MLTHCSSSSLSLKSASLVRKAVSSCQQPTAQKRWMYLEGFVLNLSVGVGRTDSGAHKHDGERLAFCKGAEVAYILLPAFGETATGAAVLKRTAAA